MRTISGYNLGRERLKEQVKQNLEKFVKVRPHSRYGPLRKSRYVQMRAVFNPNFI